MPTYEKTSWQNDSLPAIDASNLSNIENWNVLISAGGRTGVQAGSLASEHAGLPIGVQLPLNATLVWTDSNMGTGSGLDADKLDGQHGSWYMPITGTSGAVTFGGTSIFSDTATFNGGVNVTGGSLSGLTSLGCSGTITAGAFNVSSTRAIKENITPLKLDATTVVNATPVYSYSLKSDEMKYIHLGFMTEDSPSCIVHADGHAIDLYASLAIAYKSIQELTARIETLERK